jgi:NAD(P)H-flavin reductase
MVQPSIAMKICTNILLFDFLVQLLLSTPTSAFLLTKTTRPTLNYRRQNRRLAVNTSLNDSSTTNGETSWHDATVISTESACPSGKSLLWKVQVDDSTAKKFTRPGQFIQLRKNDKTDPLFLAMCSSPSSSSENCFEFLVKTTPNIPWLTEIESNMNVQISDILGSGFDTTSMIPSDDDDNTRTSEEKGDAVVDDNKIQHLMLVGAGSGIAPLMACLKEIENTKDDNMSGWTKPLKDVVLTSVYYGEWTIDDVCFQDAFEQLQSSNVRMIPCLSKQERDFSRGIWKGHVQDVLWQQGIASPEKTTALICGMDDMVHDVRQLLKRAGVKEDRIITNVQA